MAMQKLPIALTRPQMAFLKAEAARLGITVADLIRRIVDQHRAQLPLTTPPSAAQSTHKPQSQPPRTPSPLVHATP